MKKPIFAMLLCASFFFQFCNTPKYTAEELPEKQLLFGSGGGFAGTYIDFILLENGQIFKKNSRTNQVTELESLKKKEAKKLYQQAEEANLMKAQMHDPGNMSYYFKIQMENQKNSVTWGDNGNKPPAPIMEFYKALSDMVKDRKEKLVDM